MFSQPRAQRLRLAGIAAMFFAIAVSGPRLFADTRQVSTESLIYDLKHPDPLRRQAAVRQLGLAKHLPAIPQLVAMTHDPVATVRREVEFSLELMDDIRTLPGFVAFATDLENDIRARAVTSLVSMHLPRASGITAALTKLSDLITPGWDQDVKIVVEPDIPVDPVVVTTLERRIDDSERGIRRTAIRGLGILRAKSAIPDLLQVIREDRDDGLRFEAVRAIRKIGDPSVAPNLMPILNVNDNSVRNELIATLGSMRYRGAVADLTKIIEQAKPGDAGYVVALSALADIADPSSLFVFERLKADKSENVRLYANEGIARTADASQKTEISASRLVEKSPRVRTAQAFALLRLGQGEYLDELIRGLDRVATRDLAKEYLLETRPADRAALFAPRTVNAATRVGLADVLGLMGDPQALPTLQDMARDSDGDVARAAGKAVRRLSAMNSQ